MLDVVTQRLLTPMGLRTLAPGEPEYQPKYDGDLRARDAAYHQGTVWAWLMGPFIDAWLKVYPERMETGGEFLTGFSAHLGEACLGSISEIFDAEAPYAAARLRGPSLERGGSSALRDPHDAAAGRLTNDQPCCVSDP